MIVCDKFVFVHLHKSGGTFVLLFLQEFEKSAQMIGYHLPYAELAAEYQSLPVLGSVRNPWSYYVSWYTFQAAMQNPNPLFRVVSDDGRLDFDGTITNLVTLSESPERIDALAAVLPESFRPRGMNLTRNCIAALRDQEMGFYAFLYRRMFAGCSSPHVAKMETLRDDLIRLLPLCGRELSAQEQDFLRDKPATNTTEHGRFQDYYSDELRDLVANRDAAVIKQFAYQFD
jgi:hypothetical protein